jgi:hypothetical protein
MKHPLILAASIASLTFATAPIRADQTQLNAGDIVFLQASSDTPDTISFTPLVNIEAGTLIHFTDEGRTSTGLNFSDWRLSGSNGVGSFGEASYAWVASGNITAGTVISLDNTVHNLGLATSGDNILAYQGTLYRPQFIAGIGWDSADPFITTGTPTSNNSYLPSNLTLGTNALEASANDNTGYTGATTNGTQAALRAAINNAANWTGNNAALVSPPGTITVTDATPGPDGETVVAGYAFGVNAATYTQNATVAPSHVTMGALAVLNQTGTLDVDGGNGFNAQDLDLVGGFSTAAVPNLASDQAFEFTMIIEAGYQFDLSHISLAAQRKDANAPLTLGLYMSTDAFLNSTQVATLALSGTTWGVLDFTDAASTLYTGTLSFRLYGWDAVSAAGGLEIDEIWVDGQITAVPEPSAIGSLILGIAGIAGWRRFRRVAS